MPEPVINWEYKLWDDHGKRIKFDQKWEITEKEKSQGMVGLMEWTKRVRHADEDIDHAKIFAWIKEKGEPKTVIIELESAIEDDGYCHFRGKFPIVIV